MRQNKNIKHKKMEEEGMKQSKEAADRKCPICGKTENQVNAEKNRSGSQRCFCKECQKYYTLNPEIRKYSEKIRQQAIKTFYAGVSGRGVGKVFGFSKANVYHWIKKPFRLTWKKNPYSLQLAWRLAAF